MISQPANGGGSRLEAAAGATHATAATKLVLGVASGVLRTATAALAGKLAQRVAP